MTDEQIDFPLEEVLKSFQELVPKGDTLFQKWTCQHCGSRQTMATPNVLYRTGQCEECGKITEITQCNFLLIRRLAR
jgi:hypothetical protein